MQIEMLLAHSFNRRDDHRHIVGEAARHHRVDRNLLCRNHSIARRNDTQDIAGKVA